MAERLVSVKDYASLKGVTEETVRRWIRAGHVDVERRGVKPQRILERPYREPFKSPQRLAEERRRKRGGVYFIECGEFVKIGMATSFVCRLEGLQAMCPYPLRIVAFHELCDKDARARERALHERFAEYRHQGEWFRFDTAIRHYIADQAEPWPHTA